MIVQSLPRLALVRVDPGAALAVIAALALLAGVLALAIGAPPAPEGPLDWHGNAAGSAR